MRCFHVPAITRSFFVSLAILFLFVTAPASAAGTLIISEFRVRGPSGASDEFVEIYNNSGVVHSVASISGTGYAIAASDGVVRCTIPNGTAIPANGHYLCVNSAAYSLGSYPAGNGSASGDATFTTDIPDNAGIALFNNNTGGASFTLANRFDAVGSTSEANTLYKEGTGYPALTPFNIDSAWVRDACGKQGAVNNLAPCTQGGTLRDTDNNAADFYFVDTNGTSAGGGQRLGTPGPENLSSPVSGPATVSNAPLDTCAGRFSAPNFVRDFTSVPANNSTFGTIDIRRTFTNNTGTQLTRLRFRIIDLDTFPAASGFADLRPITSSNVVVSGVDRSPCGSGFSNITVHGTTLEQPPSQPNGGGFNSSMSAGSVTLATPLANGASVDVRFLFGIQQTGNFRVAFVTEGLPAAGGYLFLLCNTEGCAAPAIREDFNGDGRSDVLLQNSGTGDVAEWQLNPAGTAIAAGTVIASPTAAWKAITTGDFYGDQRSDIILQNSATGDVAEWRMDGMTITAAGVIASPGTAWKPVATGDFNADSKLDITLQNSATGDVSVWLMNGMAITPAGVVGTPGANYKVVVTGDFNNDGRADIVLQDSTNGNVAIWQLNAGGTALAAGYGLGGSGINWKVVATGDFNGDGRADIVLQDSSNGNVAIWQLNATGSAIVTGFGLGGSGTAWKVVGAGDFNGDSQPDIALQNSTTGDVAVWYLNSTGSAIASGAVLGTSGVAWVAQVK